MHYLKIAFILTCILFVCQPAFSNVVYTDAHSIVIDDSTYTVELGGLGLVSISNTGFISYVQNQFTTVQNQFTTMITGILENSFGAVRLSSGVTVPEYSTFLEDYNFFEPVFFSNSSSEGNWRAGDYGYLALSIFDDTTFINSDGSIENYYYGWLHMTANAEGSVTLLDYAYETSANSPISTPMPLPGSFWLFLSAISGIPFCLRHRKYLK